MNTLHKQIPMRRALHPLTQKPQFQLRFWLSPPNQHDRSPQKLDFHRLTAGVALSQESQKGQIPPRGTPMPLQIHKKKEGWKTNHRLPFSPIPRRKCRSTTIPRRIQCRACCVAQHRPRPSRVCVFHSDTPTENRRITNGVLFDLVRGVGMILFLVEFVGNLFFSKKIMKLLTK